jgi:hypothetical protein
MFCSGNLTEMLNHPVTELIPRCRICLENLVVTQLVKTLFSST